MDEDRFGGMPDQRLQTGLEMVGELLGSEIQAKLKDIVLADGFGSAMMRRGLESTYGEAWSRPGLSRAERSLVTLGVLIALRAEGELFQHVRIALRNGLTQEQVDEAIFQASPYVGLVASLLANETAKRAIAASAGNHAGE